MSAPPAMPSPNELKKRRKPKFIMDVREITQKDCDRIRAWTFELIKKHESKLSFAKWKHQDIVCSGTVEPEAIDVKAIYPFPDLHWIIHREFDFWAVLIMSKHRVLAKMKYVKI